MIRDTLILGSPFILVFIVLISVVLFSSYSQFTQYNAKTLTCFNDSEVLFEVKITNDFFEWMDGHHLRFENNGIRIKTFDHTTYFCAENYTIKEAT